MQPQPDLERTVVVPHPRCIEQNSLHANRKRKEKKEEKYAIYIGKIIKECKDNPATMTNYDWITERENKISKKNREQVFLYGSLISSKDCKYIRRNK